MEEEEPGMDTELRVRANLTLLVAEILDCKTIEETRRILSSWITANRLEPQKVKSFKNDEELMEFLRSTPFEE